MEVIVEYRTNKTIVARPRPTTKRRRKAPRKPNMRVSEVNTDRIKKYTHGKCVGTSDYSPMEEEPEIVIIKEINRVEEMREPEKEKERSKAATKRPCPQAKLSRQEKLYLDILKGEKNPLPKRRRKNTQNKENVSKRQINKKTAQRKRKTHQKSGDWEEKFRGWSPTQDWPLTENWQRRDNGMKSNRETYLRMKF